MATVTDQQPNLCQVQTAVRLRPFLNLELAKAKDGGWRKT